MTQQLNLNKIKFEDKPVLPVITGSIICLYIFVYCLSANNHKVVDFWFQTNSWQTAMIMALVKTQKWDRLLSTLFFATFAQIQIWQLLGNIYFTWIFGNLVEQRIGLFRYLILIMLSMFLPYFALTWDTYLKASSEIYYFGPVYLIAAVLGAYMVFPPEKRKLRGYLSKPKGEIFRREPRPDITEKFSISHWNFIAFFLVFQVGVHFWVINVWKGYDTVRLLPFIVAWAIGYGIAMALVYSVTGTLNEGPLRFRVIKRYHELIDLDIVHKDAIKGTAISLALPEDRVIEWVAKAKGKMRVK